MNLELVFNIINMVFAVFCNNWLSILISVIIFLYNIYLKMKGKSLLSLVINSQKDNRSRGEKVSTIFKIKFVIYTLISIYALCFAVLHFFEDLDYANSFKIFKENKENNFY